MKPNIRGWRRGGHGAPGALFAADFLPASVDLTPLMPPVLDQQSLGSCVANACCEALEFLERKSSADTLYSRLYLYYWARVFEGVAPTSDSGLIIGDAVTTLQNRGVCPESSWPYDVNQFSVQPPATCDAAATGHELLLSYSCPNMFTIKSSLSQGFPVVFGMEVYSSLMNTTTGDVQMPSAGEQSQGGHCCVFVGYDDATQRLMFRNSWGQWWGKSGNGSLPYAFVNQGLASDFVTFRRASV